MHTHTHTYTHIDMTLHNRQAYAPPHRVYTYIHTYIYIYIHTYRHKYMHTYMYTCTCTFTYMVSEMLPPTGLPDTAPSPAKRKENSILSTYIIYTHT